MLFSNSLVSLTVRTLGRRLCWLCCLSQSRPTTPFSLAQWGELLSEKRSGGATTKLHAYVWEREMPRQMTDETAYFLPEPTLESWILLGSSSYVTTTKFEQSEIAGIERSFQERNKRLYLLLARGISLSPDFASLWLTHSVWASTSGAKP